MGADAEMSRTGRWGLLQEMDGRWQSTGTMGFATREQADAEVEWLNSIQPGRWDVRDRQGEASLGSTG